MNRTTLSQEETARHVALDSGTRNNKDDDNNINEDEEKERGENKNKKPHLIHSRLCSSQATTSLW